jgi:HSP20 family protein
VEKLWLPLEHVIHENAVLGTIAYLSAKKVGEKKTEVEDGGEKYSHRESRFGRFSRSFRLPDDVLNEKKVSAKYKNGVLTLSLPRTKPVEIEGIEVEIK